MNQTSKRELELTGDLLEYAQATAILLAKKRCPKHVSPNDVAQEAATTKQPAAWDVRRFVESFVRSCAR